MRAHLALAPLLVAAAVAGCGTRTTTAPVAPAPTSDTFVLESIADARLPAPGAEAASVTEDDRAVLRSPVGVDLGRAAGVPDAVVFWNVISESLAGDPVLPPTRFSRAYALLHVAVYDAVSVAGDRRRGRLPERALMAGAAYEVLRHLFPDRSDLLGDAAAEQVKADQGTDGAKLAAWHIGRVVGAIAVTHARHDGSDAVFSGTPPTGDGIWRGTDPVTPTAGTWTTWCVASGADLEPDPPYAYGSPADLADVAEVLDISQHRTPEQSGLAFKWATGSPSSLWNEMLTQRILATSPSTTEAARAYAYLNVGMYDGLVCCWHTKYRYWVARPFQRLPGLVTVVPTPNFPSYTSEHSTISAAAAEVLAAIYPAEAAFFRAQAAEAAMSRLYAGTHFRHDNEQGLAVGRRVGAVAVERMLARGGRPLLAAR